MNKAFPKECRMGKNLKQTSTQVKTILLQSTFMNEQIFLEKIYRCCLLVSLDTDPHKFLELDDTILILKGIMLSPGKTTLHGKEPQTTRDDFVFKEFFCSRLEDL